MRLFGNQLFRCLNRRFKHKIAHGRVADLRGLCQNRFLSC